MSRLIPPCTASAWPSRLVPTPQGTTGQPSSAQMRTIAATSPVLSGKATASGRASGCQLSSCPWCSRTAPAVLSRSPSSGRSPSSTASTASGGAAAAAAADADMAKDLRR